MILENIFQSQVFSDENERPTRLKNMHSVKIINKKFQIMLICLLMNE